VNTISENEVYQTQFPAEVTVKKRGESWHKIEKDRLCEERRD
jgi:hypothetical protein